MLQKLTISFDESSHKYTTDGKKSIPSVSQIIGTGDYFSGIPIDKQKAIMAKGTILHQNVGYYVETGDTMNDPILMGFAEKFEEVKKNFGDIVVAEKPMGASYNGMEFAGKPDIVLQGAIVEIKSSLGRAERLYAMQLAAYSFLCEANEIARTEEYVIIYKNKGQWEYKILPEKYAGITPREAFVWSLSKYYADYYLNIYKNFI